MKIATTTLPILLLAVPASAQTALLREGDPDPSGVAGRTIDSIGESAVNQSGGFAVTLEVTDGSVDVDQIWGNLAGGAGAFLREPITVGTLTQTFIDESFGVSGGTLVYSARADDSAGSTGLESVWQNSTLITLEGLAIAGTSRFFSEAFEPGTTDSGVPYFIGENASSSGGSADETALFLGASPVAVLKTGDVLANLSSPLSFFAVADEYQFSSEATHLLAEVEVDTPNGDERAMTIDSVGLLLGGSLVQEGAPISAAIGGLPGEAWDDFDLCGITESGDYMFVAGTDASSSEDELIVRNGLIWAREGQVIDGKTLAGRIEGAFLNENNEIAFIWDVEEGGSTREALFFEDKLILMEGDSVDWDGDGSPDPDAVLEDFFNGEGMTLDSNGLIYFAADVEVAGASLEGFFVIDSNGGGLGSNYCAANANSTGAAASMSASGSASLVANDLVIQSTDMPNHAWAFFIVSRNQGFLANPGGSMGNLCLNLPVGRGVAGGPVNTGTTGMISGAVDWTSIPQPTGIEAAVIGETWNFQCWMRDSVMGASTSNFSDGLSVIVE